MRQRGDSRGAAKRPGKSRPPSGPNLRRQAILVALAVVGVSVGYVAAWLVGEREHPAVPVAAGIELARPSPPPTPWYKTQAPPPTLVTGPDTPIYPEPNGNLQASPRAYEEALPADIYVAPPPPPRLPEVPATPRMVPAPSVPPTASAGAPAWQRFALAAPDTGGRPMIAIVIDDMGLDRKRSARAVGLPGPLTLSYLAYADDLGEQMAAARGHGHELLLHVSMEPASRTVDPGPNALLTSLPPEEIRRRLAWGLERASGYVGINNHMGSKFTGDAAAMAVVMGELRSRGLLFLDSRTTPDSAGGREAHRAGVPLLERNVFLDNVNEVAAVNARLAEAERIAHHHGTAIAIGHPRDATLEALAAWVAGLTRRGFVLVPLTAILRAGTAQGSAG